MEALQRILSADLKASSCRLRYSIGALGAGLRYRRRAGVGVSSSGNGRLSSVYCGVIESMDRVRKSSALTGAVKLENERAADLRTRNDAVRLDFREDFDRAELTVSFPEFLSSSNFESVTGIIRSSRLSTSVWSGWSCPHSSGGGDESVFTLRSPANLRLEMSGVDGWLKDELDSSSVSRDGIDSLDIDIDKGLFLASPPKRGASSSDSSGGLRR